MKSRRWARISLVGALVLAMNLTAVSTTAGASVANTSSASGTLTISNESGELWPCSFNPYNPAVWGESVGFVYEPLVFVDTLENGKTTPWLASSYAWSDANKVLTFTIRQGVKFSDGTPMTAADVAYTFNLLKANPALDLNAVWSVLKWWPKTGTTLCSRSKQRPFPTFITLRTRSYVLPQHVWASIKNA